MSTNAIIDVYEAAIVYGIEPRISVEQLRAARPENVHIILMMNLAADIAFAEATEVAKSKAAA